MKVIILAAGRGSRLGAMTESLPKGLVQFAGMSLIERQIKGFRQAGIQEISIVTGYRPDAFGWDDIHYFHNPVWGETNMVKSLECANAWLSDSPCLIAYSDIVYDPVFLNVLKEESGDLILPNNLNWRSLWEARFEDPLSDVESFLVKNNKLISIGEKVKILDDIQGQFMGLLKTSPKGWERIQAYLASLKNYQKLDMTSLLQGLIDFNQKIETLDYHSYWLEIDSESDHQIYTQWMSEDKVALAPFHGD